MVPGATVGDLHCYANDSVAAWRYYKVKVHDQLCNTCFADHACCPQHTVCFARLSVPDLSQTAMLHAAHTHRMINR